MSNYVKTTRIPNRTQNFASGRYCIGKVLELRGCAWERMLDILGRSQPTDGKTVECARQICMLASSSRGGSSVTAELLQWQGANCSDASSRLLTLPGEEKPHLILAGLAFPTREERFDDLNEADAKKSPVSKLLLEMESEIGHPIPYCDNLQLYATQLYRRLLLQWPKDLAELEIKDAIRRLAQALRISFPQGYRDSEDNRRQVLNACARCFPFIRPSFYDCGRVRVDADTTLLANGSWSIEETPFIMPPPWHNATIQDLERGSLLLRDPSNAWRFSFWQAVFPRQRTEVLHLVRDPRESVQGLCDGWNYPFGFQTMPSDSALAIHGYTDHSGLGGIEWKRHRLNFSICRTLSRKLLEEHQQMSLVQVCAHQWKDAHESILAEVERLKLPRAVVNFADLRKATEKTFNIICAAIRLEKSHSGVAYAKSFHDRWVMATTLAKRVSHERWKNSPFSEEIRALVSSCFFDDVSVKLGLGKMSSTPLDAAPPDDELVATRNSSASSIGVPDEYVAEPNPSNA